GQSVSLSADLYGGGVVYHGTIQGIAAGTGSAFALLPAQNASGNWIKVVQRVPVRIALRPDELEAHPLRVGLSMSVEVDLSEPDAEAAAPSRNTTLETGVFDEGGKGVEPMIAKIIN